MDMWSLREDFVW